MKKTEKDPKTAASREPDPYGALKRAAHRVLVWADPAFEYDRLAVTKNFTGSPHVDKDDVTFQYALSLGDFAESGGGELVVESESGDERWVVETRNRVARVDGRFAHWVRGYDTTPRVSVSGDGIRGDEPGTNPRYSVIFYANKPSAATARLHPPADAGFVPAGTRGDGDGDARGKGEARGGVPGGGRGHRWVAPGDIHGPREVFCGDSGDRDGAAVAPADERRARGERVRPFQVDAASVFRLLVRLRSETYGRQSEIHVIRSCPAVRPAQQFFAPQPSAETVPRVAPRGGGHFPRVSLTRARRASSHRARHAPVSPPIAHPR